MDRNERLTLAQAAMERAAGLARDAEDAARSTHFRDKAEPFAAASAAWAEVARSHAALAAVLPETEPTDA
ncbi:hypothetical protein AB0G64_11090 [Streptomyces longwoodensis]|uniref:hypothetical protein n=1 Tax=Streptomyces longwoodensis TaxID=68231 RepID=UPI0033C6685F